jgi:uncharacterized protein YcbK (DUF882 family)
MTEQHDLTMKKVRHAFGPTLSSSHLVKLGALAMMGTGIFAALDKGQGQPDGGQTARGALRAPSEATASTVGRSAERFLKPETRSLAEPVEPSATASFNTAPASGPASGTSGGEGSLPVQAVRDLDMQRIAALEPEASFETARDARATSAGSGPLERNVAGDQSRARPVALRDCDLSELRAVLAEIIARFGPVTVVAGHQLKTVNHVAGSPREKLHQDCKALDFRPEPNRLDDIKTYLRSRPEISGIENYRDGVIHMDVGAKNFASRGPSSRASRPQARGDGGVAQELPPLAQTIVVSNRDHEHRDQ